MKIKLLKEKEMCCTLEVLCLHLEGRYKKHSNGLFPALFLSREEFSENKLKVHSTQNLTPFSGGLALPSYTILKEFYKDFGFPCTFVSLSVFN